MTAATVPEPEPVDLVLAKAAVALGHTCNELRATGGSSPALRLGVETAAGTGVVDDAGWDGALVALDLALERAVRATGKLTRCSSCDQPIRWVLTVVGNRMPLDPLPHPNGNVRFAISGSKSVVVVVPNQDLPVEGVSFRAHFATCPFAAAHRSRVGKVVPPRCASCGLAMDRALYAAGDRTHPTC